MADLVMLRKDARVHRYPLTQGVVTIGSSPSNQIHLTSPAVSERHAKITIIGNQCVIQALSAEAATFVNDGEVIRQELRHDDLIHIGHFMFRFDAPETLDLQPPFADPGEDHDEPAADGVAEHDAPQRADRSSGPPVQDTADSDAPAGGDGAARQPADRTPRAPDIDGASTPLPSARLVIQRGPNSGKSVILEHVRSILGSDGRRCVAIERLDDGYLARALDPTITVRLNGELLDDGAVAVLSGDEIEFAEFSLRLEVE